ncbi:MAG: double-strand break repair helicase AddA [Pseudomonadota bacterium]
MALSIPPEALAAQTRSSDPTASVWVSANAGSGKTFVLARRVVRLLLAGAPPGRILCLTYTNAAAAEMAGRVLAQLADLAAQDDATLKTSVATLAPGRPEADAMREAKTLFARTLETPGGLKIETLHAFAARLLRRFPLEAGVPAAFTLMDEAAAADLTQRALSKTLTADAPDLSALTPVIGDASLVGAVAAMAAHHRDLGRIGNIPTALKAALDIAPPIGGPNLSADDVAALTAAATAKKRSTGKVDDLAAALTLAPPAREKALAKLLFKVDGTPKAPFAPAVIAAIPGLGDRIEAEQARLEGAIDAQKGEAVAIVTAALIALTQKVVARMAAEKTRRGLLDYDDEIQAAMELVTNTDAAAWVRYKLDEGIDHVLLDEAQDTAPAQWDLVDALVSEFFAGAGARETRRTLFVVGDEKQSIYGFQGAAPKLFAQMQGTYAQKAAGADLPFAPVALTHSFRSAPQILAAVDRVFAEPDLAGSVATDPVKHRAVRALDGGVDIWPLVGDIPAEEPEAWDAPLDATPQNAGVIQLVTAIADEIAAWQTAGPDGGPPILPGDILILSRSRGRFAPLMNRELKARGIPVAGADRLNVTGHIAVKDMLALASALLSRDDLSLAATLKSPLFDLCEDALFALAHGREGSLMAALTATQPAIAETLSRWRRLARTARPFDFFAAILIGEGRRADFAARMGSEAEDALDALLDEALAFEGGAVPTLHAFLFEMGARTTEIRRASEGRGKAVRVMTVHGAKGLEAEAVFLADNGTEPVPRGGGGKPQTLALFAGDDPVPVLLPPKDEQPRTIRAALDEKAKDAQAEEHRLLYVAMTRAERHLVVCGCYKTRPPKDGMWHDLVTRALSPDSQPLATRTGPGSAWRIPAPSGAAPAPKAPDTQAPPAPVARGPAIAPPAPPPPLTPSMADEAPIALLADDRPLPAAMFGTLLHALLETGDPAALDGADLSDAARAALIAEANATLALPELTGDALAEVAVIGDVRVAGGPVQRASGRIDRIMLSPTPLIVDFKTTRAIPDGPEGVAPATLRQLAVYRALLTKQLPGVGAAVVYTAGPRLIRVEGALPTVTVA